MSIVIKTAEEIEKMRVAGKLAAEVLAMIAPYINAGALSSPKSKARFQLRSITMVFLNLSAPRSTM
jgi:methionine aminopeptidase